jgi:hypothetical protein
VQRLVKKIKINLENFALKIRLMFAFKKKNGEKRKYSLADMDATMIKDETSR